MFRTYLPVLCLVVLVVALATTAFILKEGEEPLSNPKSRLELYPTPTPIPLRVEYVDAAGIGRGTLRASHARKCVETPERAVPVYQCAALLQYSGPLRRAMPMAAARGRSSTGSRSVGGTGAPSTRILRDL